MTLRGYVNQAKTNDPQYATVSPVREGQNALDVLTHTYFQVIGSDAAEAGSSTTSIVATGHAALVGDRISWTSGNLDTREYAVLAVDTDSITTEPMAEAPVAADAFDILRPKLPVVDSQGQLSVGVTFSSDIGYGTPSTETNRVAAMLGVGAAAVSGANPVPVTGTVAATQSGTWNVTNVSGTVSLPTGAATAAKQPALGTAGSASADVISIQGIASMTAVKVDGSAVTQPVSAASLPLPTGASTATNQSTGNTSLSSIDTKLSVNNIAYTAKGKISGSSLTGSYATLLNPTSDMRLLLFFNSCDATILVSLDGGTTDSFELEPGESFSLDLASNGLKFDNAVNISAKHAGAAPTTGTIRVSGVG